MSDRVRWGTSNDTATPANSSGFNGFVNARYTGATPVGDHPFTIEALTLPEAIRWYWRVRTWNLSTDFAAGSAAVVNGEMEAGQTRELNLTTVDRLDFGSPSADANAALLMFQRGSTYRQDGSSYYPFIQISGSGTDGLGNSLIFSTNPAALTHTGSITATIDGKEIPLYYSDYGTTTHSTFVLTPAAYWPYAGQDGNPIYDTSTGDVLSGRSPLD